MSIFDKEPVKEYVLTVRVKIDAHDDMSARENTKLWLEAVGINPDKCQECKLQAVYLKQAPRKVAL